MDELPFKLSDMGGEIYLSIVNKNELKRVS